MEIEGIILNKFPHRERDLIVHFLNREGTRQSIVFYGGRGGGSKQKTSLLEFGYLLKVHLKRQTSSDLMVADEWQVLWAPAHLRHHYKAFVLTCFYLEIIFKLAVEVHPGESHQDFHGLFNVLSNSLFHLDKSVEKKNFILAQQLCLFLVKLMYQSGVLPDTEHCVHTGEVLGFEDHIFFDSEEGGFFLVHGDEYSHDQLLLSKNLFIAMKKSMTTKYADYASSVTPQMPVISSLLNFICQHFHLRFDQLKGLGLLLQEESELKQSFKTSNFFLSGGVN